MATAAIAAGASILGGILGGKGQKSAAKAAANIQANASHEANALTRDIYNQNVGYMTPYMTSGQTANSAFMELLGLQNPAPSAFAGMPAAGGGASYPYAFEGPGLDGRMPRAPEDMMSGPGMTGSPAAFGNYQYGAPAPTGVPSVPSARSAFDTYRGSTGYDFRFNEGTRALQSAFSRNLESGAASKAAIRFGQDIGSDEFARYMDLLRGQQQLGFGGASALAGVGQNFADTVNSSNRLAADAASNARLYSGQANAQMWQGLGSSFGQALGALGSSGLPSFKVGGW
jgi:hypothetical protein